MPMSTPTVAHAHVANATVIKTGDPVAIPPMNTRSQNTAESCACASDSAHSLKYDAVFDTAPRTNSIVWMSWCTTASP